MKNLNFIIVSVICILLFTNCSRFVCEEGKGEIILSEKEISSFSDLKVSGDFEVILKQEDTYSCKIETYENLISLIEVENSGQSLEIGTGKCISGRKRSKIYISAPSISYMGFSGAIKATSENMMKVNSLNIKGSGASEVVLNIETKNLDIDVSGSAKIHLGGKTDIISFDASGSGFLNASNLKAQNAQVSISGSGNCNLHVIEASNH